MLVKELIKRLQKIKAKKGNIKVMSFQYDYDDYFEITSISTVMTEAGETIGINRIS